MRHALGLFGLALAFTIQSAWGAVTYPNWKYTEIDLGIQNEGRAWTFPLKDYVNNTSGSAFRIEATGLPDWMDLDPATGILSGTPDRDGVGAYDGILFSLIVGTHRTTVRAKGQVVVTIRPPKWLKNDITLDDARENYAYSKNLKAYVENTEKAPLTFQIVSATPPAWMEIGTTTGTLFGTPTTRSASDINIRVKISATIAGHTYEDTALVHFKITASNRAPQWKKNPLNLPGALSGRTYVQDLSYAVSDPDSDPLDFAIASGPAWATIDVKSGKLSGTPQNTDAGRNEWVISATDPSGIKSTATVRVVVAKTNEAPKWQAATIVLKDAQEGTPYQVDLGQYVTDADGDSLSFLLLDGPDWLQVTPGGALIGVATRNNVGPVRLTIRADDGKGGNANADFSFFVSAVSQAPYWTLDRLQIRAMEGGSVRLDLNPYVNNPEIGGLTFGVVQTAGWGSLSSKGVFTGSPKAMQVGKNTFQFRAINMAGLGATITVEVDVEGINHAPTWAKVTVPTATEGAPYQTTVAQFASDSDKGDTLTFAKIGEHPTWLAVSAAGNLTGTPSGKHVGAQKVQVRVTDSKGEVADTSFDVLVAAINHPPRWRQKTILMGDAFEGALFNFNLGLYAVDDDGDKLIFELVSGPAWMKISATGIVGGQPARTDVGAFTAVLRVRDASSWSDVVATGAVRRQNQPPQIKTDWTVFQIKERETYQGNLNTAANVADPDGDTLNFYLKKVVSWVRLNSDGTFTATPQRSDRGPQAFAFSVDDGKDAVIGALRFEVLPNPRPPVWLVNPIQRLAMTNEVFRGSIAPNVQDLDGLAVSFTKTSGKAWLTVNPDGSLEGTPTDSDMSANRFEVLCCNEDKACSTGVLNIEVQKGLASDRVRLSEHTSKAKTNLVLLTDPSPVSKNIVDAVNGTMGDLRNLFAKNQVEAQIAQRSTAMGATGGVQSPLWTFYSFIEGAAVEKPVSDYLAPGAVTDTLIVTRQKDAFTWYTNQLPNHKGLDPSLYLSQIERTFTTNQRSWRVSTIAPTCPDLMGPVGVQTTTLPENAYRAWANKTGGLYMDEHCKVMAREWMNMWGSTVSFWAHLHAKKAIQLTRVPLDTRHIEVSVGGAVLKRDGQNPAWSYDAPTKTVRIDWSRVDKRALKPSDYLEIKYPAME